MLELPRPARPWTWTTYFSSKSGIHTTSKKRRPSVGGNGDAALVTVSLNIPPGFCESTGAGAPEASSAVPASFCASAAPSGGATERWPASGACPGRDGRMALTEIFALRPSPGTPWNRSPRAAFPLASSISRYLPSGETLPDTSQACEPIDVVHRRAFGLFLGEWPRRGPQRNRLAWCPHMRSGRAQEIFGGGLAPAACVAHVDADPPYRPSWTTPILSPARASASASSRLSRLDVRIVSRE